MGKISKDARGNCRVEVGNPRRTYYLGTDDDEGIVRRAKVRQVYRVEQPADTPFLRTVDGGKMAWAELVHIVALAVAAGRPVTPRDLARLVVAAPPEEYHGGGFVILAPDAGQPLADLFPMASFGPERDSGRRKPGASVTTSPPAWFHSCLDLFKQDLLLTVDPYTKRPTTRANRLCDVVERLKAHHEDFRMADLDAAMWRGLKAYWENRPEIKLGMKKGKVHKASVCRETVKLFRRFLEFAEGRGMWIKPRVWHDSRTGVRTTQADMDKIDDSEHRIHFNTEEVRLLHEACRTPFERCVFLLGMNCGFGPGEIANLKFSHRWKNKKGIWKEIRCVRFKTVHDERGVPGRWWLWPETRQAIEDYIATRPRTKEDRFIFVDRQGLSFKAVKVSKTGKDRPNMATITNAWRTIFSRVKGKVKWMTHKFLRKTAGYRIRTFKAKTVGKKIHEEGTGELMAVFLCHGNPVESDKQSEFYARPCFGKVNRLIKRTRRWLLRLAKAAAAE